MAEYVSSVSREFIVGVSITLLRTFTHSSAPIIQRLFVAVGQITIRT